MGWKDWLPGAVISGIVSAVLAVLMQNLAALGLLLVILTWPWFFGAIAVGVVAYRKKQQNGFGWFLFSLAVTPLFAWIVLSRHVDKPTLTPS